jgi:transposase
MLTLPPSVKIFVAVEPVDARKSYDGLSAIVQSQFGHDILCGHLFAFINRRGHQIQILFWDRSGLCIVKKRLEVGTFSLVRGPDGEAMHVEIDAAELALMLEGIELKGAKRRKRYRHGATTEHFPRKLLLSDPDALKHERSD